MVWLKVGWLGYQQGWWGRNRDRSQWAEAVEPLMPTDRLADRFSDRVKIAEASRVTAEIISPAVKLPVSSRAQPIRKGPAKPPRLPIELTAAIPAAAFRPDRKSAGIAQKGGRADMTLAMAIDSSVTTAMELSWKYPAAARQTKPTV